MIRFALLLSLVACTNTVPGIFTPPADGAPGEQGATGATGPQGPAGAAGTAGATLDEVITAVLPLLPPGPQGQQGAQGDEGATGPQGLPGSEGATGPQGNAGAQGNEGATGPKGNDGVGFSNTSVLSAVRTFNPTTDYAGSTTVNTPATFVPSVLSVVVGDQQVGAAYVDFGNKRCVYVGNNKAGSALALYSFVRCSDADGETINTMTPGHPFAFTGKITLSVGDGAATTGPIQVIAHLQIQAAE